jgi:hypothetical protein
MRGGYVDHIQVGPAHQLLWCAVAALQSMFVGEGGGPLSITGGDRDHALFGGSAEARAQSGQRSIRYRSHPNAYAEQVAGRVRGTSEAGREMP